jgi:2,3-diketo-5-methylthio-1-phosphopentane phosphatase
MVRNSGAGEDGPAGLTALCDFDGTISLIDTAEYLLDRFANGDWRGVDRLLEQGKITIEECMGRQFEMISMTIEDMTRELDGIAHPRPGFEELLDACSGEERRFRITSAGLDFYIRHFLSYHGWDRALEVVAPRVTASERGVRFEFPVKRYLAARNFKEDNVLAERAVGRRVAYIGDGTSDLWAALSADLAFAVKGSKLDRLLQREGKDHCTFTDFREIIDRLEGR